MGDYRDSLGRRAGELAAVTATDVLEHLTKDEVLETLDRVAAALKPGGVFVARVPNAVSPFSGHIRHGDFTHETWYTDRSVRQLTAACGFELVAVLGCPPVAHGVASTARVAIWKSVSALCKICACGRYGVSSGAHRYPESFLRSAEGLIGSSRGSSLLYHLMTASVGADAT